MYKLSQNFCFLYLTFFLSSNIENAYSSSLTMGLAVGHENIYGLTSSQSQNLFLRASFSKEFLGFKKNYFGFEISSRTGFNGPLYLSEEIQDSIGGPTPTVSSTPELGFLTTMRNYFGESKLHTIIKVGFDFSYLKFDRCDLPRSKAFNFLWYGGFGFDLTEQVSIYIVGGSARPLSHLNFNDLYFIKNPYSQNIISLGFTKML